MEAAVSSSMGAMGPVLSKLDLLLAPESRLQKRVKDGIGLLKEDLEEVSSALVDLSMLETPSARAKCWMEEARELSYHVEDFVDELMLTRTDAGAKIRAVSRHRVGRVKIALLPAAPRRSTRIAKIAQLRALVWQATERLERYQLEACCSSSSPMHMTMITQHHRAPALYGDAANLVGIEDSRIKLIEMLTGEAEQQLKVVSIVGPAGVGKTTLAKEIFGELRGLFDLRVFVHASRKLDMRRLFGSILSQVQPHHQLPSVAGTVQSLIDSIQEQLRDKRYFIVIDDLWEETAWDIVRGAFPEGNNCSRILATTENMNVALKCCGYMADNILKMKPLGIQDAGYLFFNRVFGCEQQCPDELKEVSYGIIRKCFGLPLSLIHVAGFLASIDYSELWYHVHDCLCSILNRSHTAEEIQKKILNLSYNSLPRHLKTCLLYFSMYPEGYIMWKGHLVKQWIAEGFINAAGGKDREETAEGYFEDLVNRGMVQPMKIDYNDEVLSCTVHHIIFDLINHNSKEEEFIAAIDYSQPITGLSTKVHRLSFRFSSAKYAKQPARITMSQLRSLGFFGFIKCMPPIVEFKHLRVLVLDFWGSHDGHISLDFSRICILFQLRYLRISGDIMVELPAQMQGLHYLETLEIDARLSAVPLDIVHLPSLLHLGLRAATKLPDGIGHIKSLCTLLYFDLRYNSEDNIWSLSNLTNLQHLHLTCSAALSSDHLKRKLVPLVFSLGKLGNLKSLTLTPDALGTAIFFDIWSGISSPPVFLWKLELLPPICFFHRLPSQIGELHKLCILKIVVKELQGNDISNISGLPSLIVCSLYVRTALTGTIVFSTMAFPALKYFKFTCGVMCLAFQAGAMPNLQRLKLCFNAHRGKNHSRMLDGIEHLLNLQEVAGRIGVLPGADESDWRVVKLLFEDTIRKHPRCPRFYSQLVDFIEEQYPPSDKFHLTRHQGSSSEHENIEKACAEDMEKHIDSRLSQEFDLPPASRTSYHHKSDEYSKHHMLVSILRDESAEPTTIDLSLLEDITNNFSTEQEIDQGGFGMVYKGILGDGVVAVKRLCGQHETVHGELTQHVIDCLMKVKHSNIVRFLGYWAQMQPNLIEKGAESLRIEQQDMLLCFEYLHNGSLRRHITDESCGFEWHTRYQIMKGICQGLDYLHENHIIHLHLKPENILLDANMVPKIADYAYARLLCEDRRTATQEIVASLDYLAPEYYKDGAISVKSDIYSLGVIIMQMVTGHKDRPNIKSVIGGWRSRLESDTSWTHTALETAYRQVVLCIEMGKSCMHRDPSKRPCIRDIIRRFAEMETCEASVTGSAENDGYTDQSVRYPLLKQSSSDLFKMEPDDLKKFDSFSRWMNNELPEVADLDIKYSSDAFWSTTETMNVADGSSIPINEQLDAFVVSPSLSQDQLFSIIDVSPSWAYNGTKTKVLITGTFLAKKEDLKNCRWSCMFGDAEVSAEVLVDGSLRCYTPVHRSGRVPFYVTCSNRVACSEAREFEFRDSETHYMDTSDQHTTGINEMHLHIRLDKLLSLEPEDYEKYVLSNGNKSEKELSTVRDPNLEKRVKEKLYYWLIHKIQDDGKGPNVLGKEGQGAIHLVAALGYDWAIEPIVAAGVNINFRDIRGWTALHWAASCGRERTVDVLIANGAASGALTDPTQQYSYGRTPADLASENGHKGIAGFLAESALKSHLSALTLKESQVDVEEICGLTAAEDFAEPSPSQLACVNSQEESLKDSLGAVRKSTQAAARIFQAFRVESFHRKKVIEYGDDDCGLSDELTLSLVSLRNPKPGHGDLHSAAVRIQNKFRGWKGRKEFMIIRQKIVKIQAHVRGHQVRKKYRKVEEVILRRRKRRGLRGFQPEKQLEGPSWQIQLAKAEAEAEDEYDLLKYGRKQADRRLERAVARLRSMD